MNWLLLCRLLGLLGMLVGGSMVFSLPWAFPACGETAVFESQGFWGLLAAIGTSLLFGGGLYAMGRRETTPGTVFRKEALAVVGLGWLFAGVLGSLPFLFSGSMKAPESRMTSADALFESVSGFTTTGASVLTQLEVPKDPEDPVLIPRCVLFWRSFTHWLGGMGIIVLFVAILGQLGAGGKALVRREVPGPINETVRPRVRETAIVMWGIYVGISGLLAGLYVLEGMSVFDALCHCFGTMATGGFSTRNGSIGSFNSVAIESTTILFMVAAGTNFTLFYLVLHHHNTVPKSDWLGRFSPLVRDPEFRVYIGILLVAIGLLTFSLLHHEIYAAPLTALRHSAFTAVSIMTTTGYGTEDFHEWSEFAKGLLLLLMFFGGCAGSTGGGIKIIRILLFQKIIRLEVERAFRPKVVRPVRIFGKPVDADLRHDVVVYVCLVVVIFIISWILLAAVEPDTQWLENGPEHTASEKLLDCASAVAATLNNIGPGLGVLGPKSNYTAFSTTGKLLLTVLMLLGRLELFAILVLFVPSFWRSQ